MGRTYIRPYNYQYTLDFPPLFFAAFISGCLSVLLKGVNLDCPQDLLRYYRKAYISIFPFASRSAATVIFIHFPGPQRIPSKNTPGHYLPR